MLLFAIDIVAQLMSQYTLVGSADNTADASTAGPSGPSAEAPACISSGVSVVAKPAQQVSAAVGGGPSTSYRPAGPSNGPRCITQEAPTETEAELHRSSAHLEDSANENPQAQSPVQDGSAEVMQSSASLEGRLTGCKRASDDELAGHDLKRAHTAVSA